MDANPYRQQNEYLIKRINELLRQKGNGLVDSLSLRNGLGKNREYSGLASLRMRLAHKDWNGTGAVPSGNDAVSGQTSDGRKLIGVPFYFFLRINTCDLTDQSQLQNLTNLAKVAKAYNLPVYVERTADAATGTEPINASLSQQRAEYIARLLCEQGVSSEYIKIKAKGGIDKFSPIQRSRHTRVMVKSLESE